MIDKVKIYSDNGIEKGWKSGNAICGREACANKISGGKQTW
ncbi:MAG: hypothetical protein ACI4ED_05000 [Suilimivivens sp.]